MRRFFKKILETAALQAFRKVLDPSAYLWLARFMIWGSPAWTSCVSSVRGKLLPTHVSHSLDRSETAAFCQYYYQIFFFNIHLPNKVKLIQIGLISSTGKKKLIKPSDFIYIFNNNIYIFSNPRADLGLFTTSS